MLSKNNLANLSINVNAIVAGSIPISVSLAFGGFSEILIESAEIIANPAEESQRITEKVREFQQDIAIGTIDDIWQQMEINMPETLAAANSLAGKIVDAGLNLDEGENLLAQMNNKLSNHLPGLTEELDKDQFCQYLILLISEHPVAEVIVALQKWISNIDPETILDKQSRHEKDELGKAMLDAIETNNTAEIQILYENGLSLDKKNSDSDIIPLMHAARVADYQTIQFMLDLGNDISNDLLFRLTRAAGENKNIETHTCLLNHICSLKDNNNLFSRLLLKAYKDGDIDFVRVYYKFKPDFDHDTEYWHNPYMEAAIHTDNAELVSLLVEHGVDVNCKVNAPYNLENSACSPQPAFHLARLYDYWNAFDALVQHDANLNTIRKNWDGSSLDKTYFGEFIENLIEITEREEFVANKFISAGARLTLDDEVQAEFLVRHYARLTDMEYPDALDKFKLNTNKRKKNRKKS